MSLPDAIFGVDYNEALVHQAIVAEEANKRQGTRDTKRRHEVRGGGRKPWRQKGTGRARAGTSRSPLWRGGGVVFGPHPRSYAKKLSKKTRRIALCKALSARILAGDVFIVPSFVVEKPKTKDFIKLIAELSPEPKTLIISKDFDENTRLAARNVQPAVLASASDVNSEHLLLFKKIVITNDALAQLAERINK